jgi:sortase (surface protein transpeptidase)
MAEVVVYSGAHENRKRIIKRSAFIACTSLILGFVIHATLSTTGIIPPPNVFPAQVTSANLGNISEPISLAIDAIGVNARIIPVGLDVDNHIALPEDVHIVGWFQNSASLNIYQSAYNLIITGHYDSQTGKAVFHHLNDLKIGTPLTITDQAGYLHQFHTTAINEYSLSSFPLESIFTATNQPQLILITCGGTFDPSTKNYSHRTVVYASPSKS